jgi:putative PIN family toxin of toxin-antitoxin system
VKIVLDTNVLVSGLLSPFGPPGRIVQVAAAGDLSLCFDARILAEYREVLLRPAFSFPAHHVQALLEQIRAAGVAVTAAPLPRPLPDPDDDAFLEVAISAAAEFLVTGNPRHFPARQRAGIRVASPAEFLDIIRAAKH